MAEPKFGKIKKVTFGKGGYQEAMIGVSFDLGGDGWVVGDFWGQWSMKPSPGAEWTDESRKMALGNIVMRINQLLVDAKVNSLDRLVGIPVRIYFKNFNQLDRWEIFKEVL